MFVTLRKILSLLTGREKRNGLLVLMMITVMAALEAAGVASVMPFLAMLGNPEVVDTNPYLARAYGGLGFESRDRFLFALGIAAFAVILFSAVFRTVTLFVMNRFIETRRHALGERLLETYLRQPYAFFLNRHSSDLARNILSEADQLVSNVLRPGMQMLAHAVVMLAIVTLLFIVEPFLAVIVAAVIGGLYGLIFVAVRGLLGRIGEARAEANKERFTAAGEALGGIKSIKLLGREQVYLSRFRKPSLRQARHLATSETLSHVPKFFIEAVGIGGILVITLVLMAGRGDATGGALGDVLPILGLYAFGGYRLLPAAQFIYHGFAKIRFGTAAVDVVHDDLHRRTALAEILSDAPAPLIPRHSVRLDHVSYTYPRASVAALHDINLDIPVGTSVGLVGSTGAGKTTLVDVLLGLLRPIDGSIRVDGAAVDESQLRAWQQTIGYVPQEIFLADATIAENIAFGVAPADIDREMVTACARMAQLHDFIIEEMSEQYDAVVGERGVRLSGGQRQRIGIARALYHDPAIMVFDEATSALDSVTEQAVMEAIAALARQKTIILIAHRLSTVRECDQVVLLEQGAITAAGAFEELRRNNERFHAMAAAAGY